MGPALVILSTRSRTLFLYKMTGPGSLSSNWRARMSWWKVIGVAGARPRKRNTALSGRPLRQPPEPLLFRPLSLLDFGADCVSQSGGLNGRHWASLRRHPRSSDATQFGALSKPPAPSGEFATRLGASCRWLRERSCAHAPHLHPLGNAPAPPPGPPVIAGPPALPPVAGQRGASHARLQSRLPLVGPANNRPSSHPCALIR